METQALMHIPSGATRPSSARPRRACVAPAEEAALIQACQPGVLDARSASALAAVARERRFGAGEVVLLRGQPATALWLVQTGRVALGTRGPAGLLQQRTAVGAAAWLDLASGLLGGAHAEDAIADSDSVLWELPVNAVLRCAPLHADLMQALAVRLAGSVHELIDGTRDLVMKDVLARCATWLLEHAELDAGGTGGTLQLQQRKRAVALELGTTAETFSRTLRELSRRGLISVHGYAISVLDAPGLRALAEPPVRGEA